MADDIEKILPTPLQERLNGALRLKEYAINANLNIPNEIFELLNKSVSKVEKNEQSDDLDIAIRDLTSITYPTTIETIEAMDLVKPNKFLWILLLFGLIVLFIAVFADGAAIAHEAMKTHVKDITHVATSGDHDHNSFWMAVIKAPWWSSIKAVCLGFLGAIVYAFFHITGIMKDRAYDKEAIFNNVVRIVLGGIMAWVFFQTIEVETKYQSILPFLAGFSTKLVFGILNQAVIAIEMTLGLEDTNTELLRREKSSSSHYRRGTPKYK